MDQLNLLLEPIRAFLLQLGTFLPKLVLALLIVLVGWLLAKTARVVARRALRAINFHILAERTGIDAALERGGMRVDTVEILVGLIYWLAIASTLLVACNSLGLTYVTDLLSRVVMFLPHLMLAVLVLVLGTYFASFVGGAVTTYAQSLELRHAATLGALGKFAVLVFVVLIALEQLQIGGEVIRVTFLIFFSGLVLALALAFGLGGQRWAAEWLDHWRAPRGNDRP